MTPAIITVILFLTATVLCGIWYAIPAYRFYVFRHQVQHELQIMWDMNTLFIAPKTLVWEWEYVIRNAYNEDKTITPLDIARYIREQSNKLYDLSPQGEDQ